MKIIKFAVGLATLASLIPFAFAEQFIIKEVTLFNGDKIQGNEIEFIQRNENNQLESLELKSGDIFYSDEISRITTRPGKCKTHSCLNGALMRTGDGSGGG